MRNISVSNDTWKKIKAIKDKKGIQHISKTVDIIVENFHMSLLGTKTDAKQEPKKEETPQEQQSFIEKKIEEKIIVEKPKKVEETENETEVTLEW